jgi:general secretion pathway protein G
MERCGTAIAVIAATLLTGAFGCRRTDNDARKPSSPQSAETQDASPVPPSESGLAAEPREVRQADGGSLFDRVTARPQGSNATAKLSAAESLVKATTTAVECFMMTMGRYPTEEEGLAALVLEPDGEDQLRLWRNGGGPFLADGKIPVDPWGTTLMYKLTGEAGGFVVYSLGPNRIDDSGAGDDIPNWAESP